MAVSLLKNMVSSPEKVKKTVGSYHMTFGWTTLVGTTIGVGLLPQCLAMQNVYDYYKFTKDETLSLKEKIYPMLKETAKFWNSFLHSMTRPVT